MEDEGDSDTSPVDRALPLPERESGKGGHRKLEMGEAGSRDRASSREGGGERRRNSSHSRQRRSKHYPSSSGMKTLRHGDLHRHEAPPTPKPISFSSSKRKKKPSRLSSAAYAPSSTPRPASVASSLRGGGYKGLTEEVEVGVDSVCKALKQWSRLPTTEVVTVPSQFAARFAASSSSRRLKHSHRGALGAGAGGGGVEGPGSAINTAKGLGGSIDLVRGDGIPLNEILGWVEQLIRKCDNDAFLPVPFTVERQRKPENCGLSVGGGLSLPNDVAHRVFSFLPARGLWACELVCWNWREVLAVEEQSRESVWRSHCITRFDTADLLFLDRQTWRSVYCESFLLTQKVQMWVQSLQGLVSVRSTSRSASGGFVLEFGVGKSTLKYFVETQPFHMSSSVSGNSLMGAELDYAVARFLERRGGCWELVQGVEDTELLHKDAVHHLIKVVGGDETGDTVFECFAEGGCLFKSFVAQRGAVEGFLGIFGDRCRYFNNGEFQNQTTDGFPLVPMGSGTMDSGVIVMGEKHIGMIWCVEQVLGRDAGGGGVVVGGGDGAVAGL